MKYLFHILAFVVLLSVLVPVAYAQGSQPLDASQQVLTVDPLRAQAGGSEMPQPTGVRSFLPMIFLVVIYILIRRMVKRMGSDDDSPFGSGRDFGPRPKEDDPEHLKDAYDRARQTWGQFNARSGQDVPAGEPRPVKDVDAPKPARVIDIKPAAPAQSEATGQEDEFLRGAKLVFERMVEAMDGLDPDAAAQFAGPEVINDIKLRMNDGHPPAQSEVVSLECSVMERKVVDGQAIAVVYYDAVKQVSGLGPIQMRQLWTFTKDDNDPDAMWILQSLEPVEA